MLGHLIISRHLTFLQCFLYSQESAYHHKDLFNTSVTELLVFYESRFPAVYFEHFILLMSRLSSATCLLTCHLNFAAYHSLKQLSYCEGSE